MMLLLSKEIFLGNKKKQDNDDYEKIPGKWQDLMWNDGSGNGRETKWM